MSKPMGRPRAFTDVKCQTCPALLVRDEVKKGLRRCRECRAHRVLERPKTTVVRSPWEGKSREELSAWVEANDKERRKGSQSFAYPIGSGGLP